MKRKDNAPFMFKEFKLAYRLCVAFGQSCEPGSVAFAVGAGGCGKSTIAQHLANTLFGPPAKWPLGSMPLISVEADNVDRAYFTTKSLMRSMLSTVHDPFRSTLPSILNWDIDDDLKERLVNAISGCNPLDKSEPDMRTAFIEIAKLLGVKVIVVDEGNLLALTQRGRVPTDYLESLRRLADQIGCGLLLLGTLDMLELMEYSAQLNRRGLDIHVDRMRCETEEGKLEFLSFLEQMEEDYGLDGGVLTGHSSEVHEGTYGIPGEIVGLIDRAELYGKALEDERIDWSHFLLAIHHPSKIARMREEADLISRVINGEPLKTSEKATLAKRRKNRMSPKRRKLGEPA